MEARIEAVKDIVVYARVLLYGDPGTEKTRIASSACKVINPKTKDYYRVLILDCNEDGTMSVRDFDTTGKYLRRLKIRNIDDLERAFWYLKLRPNRWDIVILDTTTELQYLSLRGVIDEDADGDASRDRLMPHKRDYGKTGEILRMWITNFRSLPMHICFTAHEGTEDESDEDSSKWPDIQRAVKNRLCAAVDIIGRTYHREVKGQVKSVVYFGKHEFWKTKDRSGKLPNEMRNPSLSRIIELIQGSEKLAQEQQGKKVVKKKKSKKSK